MEEFEFNYSYFINEALLFEEIIKSSVPNSNKEKAFQGLVECRHRCVKNSSQKEKDTMFSILLLASYQLETQLVNSVFK